MPCVPPCSPRTSARAAAAVLSARLNAGDLVPAANRADLEGNGEDRVPDVFGKSARDAVRLLASHGLSAHLSGTGFVVSQDPPAGSPAGHGGACSLVLAPVHTAGETP